LEKLVRLSDDLYAEATDSDVVFLEREIAGEKDPEFKEALQDLNDFLFCF
jgi:hypothetical protein